MNRKSLLNQLELAYAPLTAYEFAILKNDTQIERALKNASLYVIAQRPVITFENMDVDPSTSEFTLNFEIHQKGNPNILRCRLPLVQKVFGMSEEDAIAIGFNYLDKTIMEKKLPLGNLHCFSLLKHRNGENEPLMLFTPEKLLQNWWKGYIACEVEGDFRSFTQYKVHYVGKATKQSILKRLTGHSTFQDILSLETPVTAKQLPANEIVVLPFGFQDNIQISNFSYDSDVDIIIDAIQGKDYPEQEKIFLDAEKALIKAMDPVYNKEKFKNYPFSKDGLYDSKYDTISYTFIDPITLIYEGGQIMGGLSSTGGDSIFIVDNKDFFVVQHEE